MRFFRSRFLEVTTAVILAIELIASSALGQNVVLHLKNGDRLAGFIVAESTNQITISNVWIKALSVPFAEIDKREFVSTNSPAATVKEAAPEGVRPPKGTNAVTLGKPAVPVTSTNWWLSHWKGEVSLGANLIYGASDQQIYFLRSKFTFTQPYQRDPKEVFRNIFSYNVDYGRTDGVVSADKMDASSKTDFDLTRKTYLYNLGGAGYDEVRLINLSYEEGPGVGYHLFDRTNFVMNLEWGINYQVEDRADGTFTRDFYNRLAENISWKLNKQLSLTEKFELFPRADDVGQYRARFEGTLSYALFANLALNLTMIDLYDTRPAATVSRNEFQLRTSLGIKF